MKQITPKLKYFAKAMRNSADNTVVFEKCTVFNKYNTPDQKYTSILNLCTQDNYILNEVIPYLKKTSNVKIYEKEAAEKYYGKPMKLSYDLFGITDYWWILLAVNNYFDSQDFTGWNRLIIPVRSDMENIMDRVLYSNPDISNYIEN